MTDRSTLKGLSLQALADIAYAPSTPPSLANAAYDEIERRPLAPVHLRLREPRECPRCGNLYDHRYPCVG